MAVFSSHDANVSVHKAGTPFGTRREIKNLNSFRFLEQAIIYEAQWQIEQIESGNKIHQATVLFDPDKGETRMMRSKEEAHDYRYFPDPDSLPLEISPQWIDEVRTTLPELPQAKQARYVNDLGLSAYDAGILTASREMADFFEAALSEAPSQAKACANWLIGEVSAQLNRDGLDMAHCPITTQQLGGILKRIADNTISNSGAKEVFRTMWAEGGEADAIIEAKGLKQVFDSGAIEALVDDIIAANADKVAEYRAGRDKLFGFFVPGDESQQGQGKSGAAK